jgi:hypothetical protein
VYNEDGKNKFMKNKTLTKNMPNVKWNELPPRKGPDSQGIKKTKVVKNVKTNKFSV